MQLNPEIIGRAEAAHKPLMQRALDGTGTTFPQWVALKVAARGGLVIETLTAALKADRVTAQEAVAHLTAGGLMSGGALTEAGRERYRTISARIDDTIGHVYAGIAPSDLETAARVLTQITAAADAEAAAPARPGPAARR